MMNDVSKETYIEREQDSTVYNNYLEAKKIVKSDGHPVLFSTVAPAGSGKTHLIDHFVSRITDECICNNLINIDLLVIENDKNAYYAPFVVYMEIAVNVYYKLLEEYKKTKKDIIKTLLYKCEDYIRLWTIYSQKNNLDLDITLDKKGGELLIGTISLFINISKEMLMLAVPGSAPFFGLSSILDLLTGKATDEIEKTIAKNSKKLHASYNDILNDFELDRPEEALKKYKSDLLKYFTEAFAIFINDPFFIILDNAEMIEEQKNRFYYSELLFKDMPVIWYISGQTLPFKEDIVNSRFIKYMNNKPSNYRDLNYFSVQQTCDLLKKYGIKVDNQDATEEQAQILWDRTQGNPLWLSVYITDLMNEKNNRISEKDFFDVIDVDKYDIMQRMLGCDLLGNELEKFHINTLLYGLLPNSNIALFDEIANRCGGKDINREVKFVITKQDGSYYVHTDLAKYTQDIIRKEYAKENDTILTKKIFEIINSTGDYICKTIKNYSENYIEIKKLINDYTNFQFLFTDHYSTRRKKQYDLEKSKIIVAILEHTHDSKFIYKTFVHYSIPISKESDYLLKTYEYLFGKHEFVDLEDLISIHTTFRKKILDKNFDLDYLDIDKRMFNSNLGLIKNTARLYIVEENTYPNVDVKRYFKFLADNCAQCLKKILDYDFAEYNNLKNEYLKVLRKIENDTLNNNIKQIIIPNKFDIVINEKITHNNAIDLLMYFNNEKNNIARIDYDTYLTFQTNVIRSLLQIRNGDNEINYVNELFSEVFNNYLKDVNVREDHKKQFIGAFVKYIQKYGLNENIEQSLIESINKQTNKDIFLDCLLSYYDDKNLYNKIISLLVHLCDKYCIDTEKHVQNSFSKYMCVIYRALMYKIINNNQSIDDKKFNKITQFLFKNNYSIFGELYEAINEPGIVKLNHLLDLYFMIAKANFRKEDLDYYDVCLEVINNSNSNIAKKYGVYDEYRTSESIYKGWIYDNQIDIENAIIITIAYIFRFTKEYDSNTYCETIKSKCIDELSSIFKQVATDDITFEDIKVYTILSPNIYRKVFNISIINSLIFFRPKAYSNIDISNYILESTTFKEKSISEFANESSSKKEFIKNYIYEYNCKSIDIDFMLNNYFNVLNQSNNGIDIKKGSIAFNIVNKLSNDYLFNLNATFNTNRNHFSILFTYLVDIVLWAKNDDDFKSELEQYVKNSIILEYIKVTDINVNLVKTYIKYIELLCYETDNLDIAEDFFDRIIINTNNNDIKGYVYRQLAKIKITNKKAEEAIEYFKKSIDCAFNIIKNNNIDENDKLIGIVNSTYDYMVKISYDNRIKIKELKKYLDGEKEKYDNLNSKYISILENLENLQKKDEINFNDLGIDWSDD